LEWRFQEDAGCKKTRPLTEDEIFDIVLEKVRATSPRINALHLNTRGTKEELTADRAVDLLQTQELEARGGTKRRAAAILRDFGFKAKPGAPSPSGRSSSACSRTPPRGVVERKAKRGRSSL
jgi:hypothetical protein